MFRASSLAGTITLTSGDSLGLRCQRGTLKDSYRIYDALWKELLVAKRSVLAGRDFDARP